VKYPLSAYATGSFWRYALFSWEPLRGVLSILGGFYLVAEMLDFFGLVTRDQYPRLTPFALLAVAATLVVITRRPVTRVTYKLPKKDYSYVVCVGDLFDCNADIVVSCNTTFETDMSSGRISPQSLQGQLATRFFDGKTDEIDKQIQKALKGVAAVESEPGKRKRYPIGTVAKVTSHGTNFYLLAMAELNDHGTARSSVPMVDTALDKLWDYLAEQGELRDIAVPVIGTGRGRVEPSRKKIVERIAQSFADASRAKRFCNKLVIVISREDAEKYDVSLFEIRDFLVRSLDI